MAGAYVLVACSVEDERGHANTREDTGEVGAHEDFVDRCGGAGTCTETLRARTPATKSRLARAGRREIVDQRSAPGDRAIELDVLVCRLGRHPERRLGTAQEA